MNLDNLYYSKQDSSKAIESEVVQANKPDEFAEIGGMGADDTDYTKGEPFIDTGIVFILSGGSEREKDYFRPLKIDKQIHNVKIAFRSKKRQGLKPYELASLASEFVSSKSFTTEDNGLISYREGRYNLFDSRCRRIWIRANETIEIRLRQIVNSLDHKQPGL